MLHWQPQQLSVQAHETAAPAFQTYLVSVFAVTPDLERPGEPLQESLDRESAVTSSLWDPEQVNLCYQPCLQGHQAHHVKTAAGTPC